MLYWISFCPFDDLQQKLVPRNISFNFDLINKYYLPEAGVLTEAAPPPIFTVTLMMEISGVILVVATQC